MKMVKISIAFVFVLLMFSGQGMGQQPAEVCIDGIQHHTVTPGQDWGLCWRRNLPAEGVTHYEIFRSTTSGSFDTAAAPWQTFQDPNCDQWECNAGRFSETVPGDYYYAIRGRSPAAFSGLSNEARLTVLPVPTTPDNGNGNGCSIVR